MKCPPSGQRAKHSTSRAVGGQWAGEERRRERRGRGAGGGGIGFNPRRLLTTLHHTPMRERKVSEAKSNAR